MTKVIATVILAIMVTHTSASFFDTMRGAFQPLENSVSKLFSDVVSDLRTTIDCTILAVERAFSWKSMFGKSADYYDERCTGRKKKSNVTSDPESVKDKEKSMLALHEKMNNTIKNAQEANIIEEKLKNETLRLQQIHKIICEELDKLTADVEMTVNKFDHEVATTETVLSEVRELYEIEQHDKSSSRANEVRHTFDKVLNLLQVNDTGGGYSDDEEVKQIMKGIGTSLGSAMDDVEIRFKEWKQGGNNLIKTNNGPNKETTNKDKDGSKLKRESNKFESQSLQRIPSDLMAKNETFVDAVIKPKHNNFTATNKETNFTFSNEENIEHNSDVFSSQRMPLIQSTDESMNINARNRSIADALLPLEQKVKTRFEDQLPEKNNDLYTVKRNSDIQTFTNVSNSEFQSITNVSTSLQDMKRQINFVHDQRKSKVLNSSDTMIALKSSAINSQIIEESNDPQYKQLTLEGVQFQKASDRLQSEEDYAKTQSVGAFHLDKPIQSLNETDTLVIDKPKSVESKNTIEVECSGFPMGNTQLESKTNNSKVETDNIQLKQATDDSRLKQETIQYRSAIDDSFTPKPDGLKVKNSATNNTQLESTTKNSDIERNNTKEQNTIKDSQLKEDTIQSRSPIDDSLLKDDLESFADDTNKQNSETQSVLEETKPKVDTITKRSEQAEQNIQSLIMPDSTAINKSRVRSKNFSDDINSGSASVDLQEQTKRVSDNFHMKKENAPEDIHVNKDSRKYSVPEDIDVKKENGTEDVQLKKENNPSETLSYDIKPKLGSAYPEITPAGVSSEPKQSPIKSGVSSPERILIEKEDPPSLGSQNISRTAPEIQESGHFLNDSQINNMTKFEKSPEVMHPNNQLSSVSAMSQSTQLPSVPNTSQLPKTAQEISQPEEPIQQSKTEISRSDQLPAIPENTQKQESNSHSSTTAKSSSLVTASPEFTENLMTSEISAIQQYIPNPKFKSVFCKNELADQPRQAKTPVAEITPTDSTVQYRASPKLIAIRDQSTPIEPALEPTTTDEVSSSHMPEKSESSDKTVSEYQSPAQSAETNTFTSLSGSNANSNAATDVTQSPVGPTVPNSGIFDIQSIISESEMSESLMDNLFDANNNRHNIFEEPESFYI